MLRIGIITGSTRPNRKSPDVAKWVLEIANKRGDADYEVVDIKEFELPLLDEPLPPSRGQFEQPHTKFRPGPKHEKSVGVMLDQVVARAGALKQLR